MSEELRHSEERTAKQLQRVQELLGKKTLAARESGAIEASNKVSGTDGRTELMSNDKGSVGVRKFDAKGNSVVRISSSPHEEPYGSFTYQEKAWGGGPGAGLTQDVTYNTDSPTSGQPYVHATETDKILGFSGNGRPFSTKKELSVSDARSIAADSANHIRNALNEADEVNHSERKAA